MPELTIEVTNEQWQRIRAAFTVIIDGVPTPPTALDMRKWILGQVAARVRTHEMNLLHQAREEAVAEVEAAKRAELAAEGWEV